MFQNYRHEDGNSRLQHIRTLKFADHQHGMMTNPRARIAEKLHSIGAAQDGPCPNGVTPRQVADLGTDDYDTVKNELEEMDDDPEIPVERCGPDRYRLESMNEGKKYKIEIKPIQWWIV